jgi:hypothetical protein
LPPDAQLAGADRVRLLRAGETLESGLFRLGPSDGAGLIVIVGPPYGWPAGYLGLDLSADGQVWGRVDLPASAASGAEGDGVWEVSANLAGGVMLVHWAPDRTEIVRLHDVTGERTVVTVLPVDSLIVPRGGARTERSVY